VLKKGLKWPNSGQPKIMVNLINKQVISYNMKRLAHLLFVAALFIILINTSYAQLYGDLTFNVKENGEVAISGNTNYDQFKGTNNELTSKNKNIWYLNITSPIFDEYKYLIKLPKYSVMNVIKANNKFVIGEKDGVIAVSGFGAGEKLDVFIEYAIDKEDSLFDQSLMIAGLVLILIIGGIVYFVKRKITSTPKKTLNRSLYTERQLLILDYLQEHGTVTQAALEKELGIPKASLSRNIKTLVQKEIIFSETKGMSNIVGLR